MHDREKAVLKGQDCQDELGAAIAALEVEIDKLSLQHGQKGCDGAHLQEHIREIRGRLSEVWFAAARVEEK